MAGPAEIYRVVIRSNVVAAVEPAEPRSDHELAGTNLEAGTRLAMNNRENGCIDGVYHFADLNKAKDFAVLSLDFAQRLTEKSLENVKAHNFFAMPAWRNPLLAAERPQET